MIAGSDQKAVEAQATALILAAVMTRSSVSIEAAGRYCAEVAATLAHGKSAADIDHAFREVVVMIGLVVGLNARGAELTEGEASSLAAAISKSFARNIASLLYIPAGRA